MENRKAVGKVRAQQNEILVGWMWRRRRCSADAKASAASVFDLFLRSFHYHYWIYFFFSLSLSLSLAFFILRRSFLSQFNSKNCNVGNLSFLPFFSLEEEVWELIKLSEWLGLVLIYLLYGCVILSINLSVVCVWCMGHLIEAAIALNRRWQMRLVSLSSC